MIVHLVHRSLNYDGPVPVTTVINCNKACDTQDRPEPSFLIFHDRSWGQDKPNKVIPFVYQRNTGFYYLSTDVDSVYLKYNN